MTLRRTIKRREQRKRARHRPKPRPLTPAELALVKDATNRLAESLKLMDVINREYDADRKFISGEQWEIATPLRFRQ